MADQALPCPTVLRLLLRYEPETGVLVWKERPRAFFKTKRSFKTWNARYAGTKALECRDNHGYCMGAVGKCRHMKAHRAIWAIVYGEYPNGHIDHVNGKRDDNRLTNLRTATHTENQRNMRRNRRNKTGQVGVFWLPKAKRWWSYIGSGETRRTIGYYADYDDAVVARKKAEAEDGYHAAHGMTDEERLHLANTSILRSERERQR